MENKNEPVWEPTQDGETHINIYSKGLTELGRALSNFYHSPFVHPEFGRFYSMEGFWYWLKTGMQHDSLRELSGFYAKEAGKRFDVVELPNFLELIKEGLAAKIGCNPAIKKMLLRSTLPFTHYYVYGGKVVPSKSGEFLVDYYTQLRADLKDPEKCPIIYGEVDAIEVGRSCRGVVEHFPGISPDNLNTITTSPVETITKITEDQVVITTRSGSVYRVTRF